MRVAWLKRVEEGPSGLGCMVVVMNVRVLGCIVVVVMNLIEPHFIVNCEGLLVVTIVSRQNVKYDNTTGGVHAASSSSSSSM